MILTLCANKPKVETTNSFVSPTSLGVKIQIVSDIMQIGQKGQNRARGAFDDGMRENPQPNKRKTNDFFHRLCLLSKEKHKYGKKILKPRQKIKIIDYLRKGKTSKSKTKLKDRI